MKLSIVIGLCACLFGCVPKGRYDEALLDNQRLRAESGALGKRTIALEADLGRLSQDMQTRDIRLADDATNDADEKRKIDDLVLMNAELSHRLTAAGQSVEHLATERGSLTRALTAMRARLDELNRQELAAEARTAQFNELMKSFKRMVDAGKLKVVIRRGLMLVELPNDVLFDSGKTVVKDKAAIAEVARVLRALEHRSFQVAGHTDDVKIQSAKFPSNWELSTARAVEVTKLLIQDGMNPRTVSAAGYGEFAPVAGNDTEQGRAQNRRIEIALVPNMEEMVKLPIAPEGNAPMQPSAASTTPSPGG